MSRLNSVKMEILAKKVVSTGVGGSRLGAVPILLGLTLAIAPAQEESEGTDRVVVAHRYDNSRVVFLLKTLSIPEEMKTPGLHDALEQASELPEAIASGAGMRLRDYRDQDFWGKYQKVVAGAALGEKWLLDAGLGRRFEFEIEKHVVSQMACDTGIAAIRRVVSEQISDYAAVAEQHYVAARLRAKAETEGLSEFTAPRIVDEVAQSPAGTNPELETMLTNLLAEHLPEIREEAQNDVVNQRSGIYKSWVEYDERLARGEGQLFYDRKTLDITPDGDPCTYARAKWILDGKVVFLLSAWIRISDSLEVDSFDVRLSGSLRMQEFQHIDLDLDWLGRIHNVFDRDRDGWGELLIDSSGYESYGLELYEYSDNGPTGVQAAYHFGC